MYLIHFNCLTSLKMVKSKNVWQIFSKFPPIIKVSVVKNMSMDPIRNINATDLYREKKTSEIIVKYRTCNNYIGPICGCSFINCRKGIYFVVAHLYSTCHKLFIYVKATDIIMRHPPQLDPQPRFVGIASPSPHKHPQHIPTMFRTGINVNRPINPYPKYCLKYLGNII